MVSRTILEKHGCSAEAWRKHFENDDEIPPAPLAHESEDDEMKARRSQKEKLDRLKRRVRSRVRQGIDYNLLNYRTCWALDLLWNAPFRQISPTLLSSFAYRTGTTEELQNALTGLGLNLSEILVDTDATDKKTGQKIKQVSVPSMITVIVPLVRAYLQIRRARLINDRNLKPFVKYESALNTAEQRVKCEVLTSRVEVMAKQYDYLGALNQAVFQMLLYNTCLEFTLEDWHFEEQLKFAEPDDVRRFNDREEELAKKNGSSNGKHEPKAEESNPTPADSEGEPKPKKKLIVGEEMIYTTREGLRYYHPHPTRTYWDQAHAARTLNTGTGCEFAGHWRVMRWKEIRDNPGFYNKSRVSWGGDAWWSSNVGFFNSVYNTCVMAWPTVPAVPDGQDREAFLAQNSFYNESHGDNSIVVTEHREIVVPKDDGLGDYPYPIWARFVVAGDGTIVYASPMCYRPVNCFRDNGDDRKIEDASMGLMLAPHQDMLSNLLSQYIYAVKQNLANFTLIDQNVMPKEFFEKVRNRAEDMIRGLNIFPFDSKVWQKKMIDPTRNTTFYSHRFPALDTNGLLSAMKVVIDLAERVLQFSNQEVAQAATHEQTKAEMDIIHSATNNVLQYTGVPVDQALEARAIQIYEALMNYADDDFFAYIPSDHNLDKESLEKMGITVIPGQYQKDKRLLVRSKKSALVFQFFGLAPTYWQRKNNVESARMISEMVRDWFMSNPMGLSALGPDQLIDLANYIAKLADIPLERPLTNVGMTTQEQNMAAQQQLRAMVDEVLADVKKGTIPIVSKIHEQEQEIDALYATLRIPKPTIEDATATQNGSPPNGVPSPEGQGLATPA